MGRQAVKAVIQGQLRICRPNRRSKLVVISRVRPSRLLPSVSSASVEEACHSCVLIVTVGGVGELEAEDFGVLFGLLYTGFCR